MSALSRWLSRFCYNHPRFGIPNLMKYIAIGNVIVFLLDLASEGMFSMLIGFYPGYIAQGQIWRLVTFIFVPQNSSALWFVVSVMLYYFLGNELERVWGSVRFTVYYATGVVMTIVMGLLLTLAGSSQPLYYYVSVTMYYVNMSMFFAFATLYPEAQFRLYFILPVKAKWLAWLDVALFAWGDLQQSAQRPVSAGPAARGRPAELFHFLLG